MQWIGGQLQSAHRAHDHDTPIHHHLDHSRPGRTDWRGDRTGGGSGGRANLLPWLAGTEEHLLITSSVFHYEFEFIHPFYDGNGRMGRLWQTLTLTRWKPLFADVPVESLVHAGQGEYYEAIRISSPKVESTPFIVFMLEAILEAVRDYSATDQVARRLAELRYGPKSATKLMAALGLSHRPTFLNSDIHPALSAGLVEMTRPESPTAKNHKYRLTARGRPVNR